MPTTEALPYPDVRELESNYSDQIGHEPLKSEDPATSEVDELATGKYRIRILGSLGSGDNECQARAINDHDQIAGHASGNNQHESLVLLWDTNNGIIALGNENGCCAEAWDINNQGHVVGQLGLGRNQHGFFSPSGTVTELELGDVECLVARAINERGIIAGSLKIAESGERVGFVLALGVIHEIRGRNPSPHSTEVFDINNQGEAVGFTRTQFGRSAYRWTPDEGMILLPSMEGESVAYSINDAGVIAGWCRDERANYCAVLWKDDAVIPCGNGRNENSLFFGLNELDEAVGMMHDSETERWRGSFWDGEKLSALPDQSGWMNWATDINNFGTICGTAFVPQIATFQASVWYRS